MIDKPEIDTLRAIVDTYWRKTLKDSPGEFFRMATGKEGGHQLSDKVDQLTTSFLHATYPTRSGFQHKGGKPCSRSMGDIWFRNARSEWSPINVKTGLVGSEGQPNIVSLKRVMTSIFDRMIDSYYLLLVKFAVNRSKKSIMHRVYMVDMLDWLSLDGGRAVLTFNAGPGQMMIKADRFFKLLDDGFIPEPIPIQRKVELLMKLYLLGERNLMRNRARDRKKFKSVYDGFMQSHQDFSIDVERQREFSIQ